MLRQWNCHGEMMGFANFFSSGMEFKMGMSENGVYPQ